jgi:hypothetical protein
MRVMADPSIPLQLQEVTTLLASTPVVLRDLLTALPGEATSWHPGVGKWCINEVVGHLLDEDCRDFVSRIRLILQQHEPRLTITDEKEVARMRRDCDKSLDDLLREFTSVRQASASFVSTLHHPDLHLCWIHPKIGHLSIANLLHEWIYHDLSHISQIRGNVQSFLWMHLGNAQRFYQP